MTAVRRPGDRRVRVSRSHRPQEYKVKPARRVRPPMAPQLVLVYGFAALIGLGTLLLTTPVASASGNWTRPVDALFTATSAVCVTGLVVFDTGTYWSPIGQFVILALIQVGGFGFMTSSTLLLVVLARRRTTLRDRVLVSESLGMGETDLGGGMTLVRRVALFSLAIEGAGAIMLVGHQLLVDGASPADLWWGVFHAVSAFNNAGFDITGNFSSLVAYQHDWIVLLTVAVLIILGGIGFAVVFDVRRQHRWVRFSLETKIVLATTLALLVAGSGGILLLEWDNPATLGALPPGERILNAVFHAVTPRTAGFNSLPMAAFNAQTLFLTMGLMFIGGASGSTAGGLKVNTFGVLWTAILSSVRGQPSAAAFGRRIPHALVYRALAVAVLYVMVAFTVALALQAEAPWNFIDTAFETISALGTVGLSTGVTPTLDGAARLLLTLTMFVGRLGPLTLVLALAQRARPMPYRPAVETLRIG